MTIFELPSVTFKPTALLSGAMGPWGGHLPFAYDLTASIRPRLLVELGVFYGDSYFGFCQAVAENDISCVCYGVDTWRGDNHGGHYENSVYEAVARHNEQHYSSFSYLLRSEFDNALSRFSQESIDLLHIDGFHSYEAVQHDFETWYSKVRPGGIILFHDIAIRFTDFGVWQLWEELQSKFRTFSFQHSNGLGVLLKPGGEELSDPFLRELFYGSQDSHESIRRYYTSCADALQAKLQVRSALYAGAGHSLFQVFFCRGTAYSAENSLGQIVKSGEWLKVSERLPFGVGGCSLRIDPTNRACVVSIRKIELRKTCCTPLWSWDARKQGEIRVGGTATRLPSVDTLQLFSYGDDPQIFLPELPHCKDEHPIELEIQMEIDLEFNALRSFAERAQDLDALRDAQEKRWAEQKDLYQSREEAMRGQIQELQRLNLSTISDRERAYAASEQLRTQIELLRSEIHACQTTNQHLRNELDEARRQLQENREIRLRMERSHSWTLTAPFRKGMKALRRS